mmetsp:Transcript_735/g.2668  ORF Transcript_735/g.2668 Transcript_735/m.2668 type:complete len:423 (-) Transcript_735:1261-2529(-)
MEAVVQAIQALSATGDLERLHSRLQAETLRAELVPQALTALDPGLHTLGCIHLLHAWSESDAAGREAGGALGLEAFAESAARFLAGCAPLQVRLAVEKYCAVCRALKEAAVTLGCPKRAILPLRAAARALAPAPGHVTPVHADLLQVCLLSKCYSAALPTLEAGVVEVDPANGVTPRDFLLYCYYGGMACVGAKRYPAALELFLFAITAPSMVLSAVVVAAYKKYILVSLVEEGAVATLPKYTASIVHHRLKGAAAEYTELAAAYATRSVDKLQACMEKHAAVYGADAHLGLVKQVLRSLYTRNIQRLTQTYLTLSLRDIAESVQLASPREAETHILRMIEQGEIFASINQKDGMVSFEEDPERYDDGRTARRLDRAIQSAAGAAQRVKNADEAVLCDKPWLAKTIPSARAALQGGFDDPNL